MAGSTFRPHNFGLPCGPHSLLFFALFPNHTFYIMLCNSHSVQLNDTYHLILHYVGICLISSLICNFLPPPPWRLWDHKQLKRKTEAHCRAAYLEAKENIWRCKDLKKLKVPPECTLWMRKLRIRIWQETRCMLFDTKVRVTSTVDFVDSYVRIEVSWANNF